MSGATAPCAPPSPAPQSPLGATRALAPRARLTAAGGVFGPGRVGLRLHLGQLRRAPVAAAGAALPPACAAPGGREGERPAVGVRVVGGRVVGWAARSLPAPQNPTPHLFVRSTLRITAPAWCSAPPWLHPSSHLSSHCLSHPLFRVSSAHPPMSSTLPRTPTSSASISATIAVPSHSSSLFHPYPSLHPSARPPAPNLLSLAFLLPSIHTPCLTASSSLSHCFCFWEDL